MKGFGEQNKSKKQSTKKSNPSKEQIINQAFEFHLQGNLSEAAKYYQYCIDKGFNDQHVFSNYSSILQSLGNFEEAEISIRKAIALSPDFAEAHSNLGNILIDLGKLKEAEVSLRKAIKLKPSLANAHYNHAISLKKLGQPKKAEVSIQKAIDLNPNFADSYYNLGSILIELGKLKEAERSTRKAINLNPNSPDSHYNLGVSLKGLGKLKEAEISTRKAIELNPNFVNAYCNLGSILQDLGNLNEAEVTTRKAIEIDPNFATAHCNLGSILLDLGNLKQAEVFTRKAIEIDPRLDDAKNNLSLILLKTNNFKEGLINYESRWKVTGMKKPFITSKPEWSPKNRGTVLLWGEQGIGDVILFASLIPEFVKLVDQLIIKIDPRLITLFKRSFDQRIGYIQHDQKIEEEKYDFQIAMGSLLKYMRTEKESFKKGKNRYLKVNEIKTNIFRDKLIQNSKFERVIGISWKSNSKKIKSISLEKFILGIYSPNICFLNLQYGDTKDEVNYIKTKYNINIFEIQEVDIFNNLDDLSALISACDMVVSIENIIFALAGGLGIESKILLKRNCEWFNGDNDSKSYWFTKQTFYRQSSTEGWGKELSLIKKEIELST